MATGKGFLNIAGFKKESVFGTPVEVGALNGFEFLSESIAANVALIENMGISGSAAQNSGDKGIELHAGDISFDARYEGVETLMAMGFGTAGTPARQVNRQTADGAGDTGASTKITSATAAFLTTDVGKRITLAGAGVAGALLDTTITARDSATQVTIAGTVATTVSNAALIIYDSAYKHTIKLAGDLEDLFGTLALWVQGLNVKEYVSVKVNSIEWSIKKGDRAKITMNVFAHKLNINTSSGTNTTTTAATITFPANRAYLNFSQMVVRINDNSAGALSSGDNVYVSELKWKLENKLATDDVTTQFGYLIDEGVRDNFLAVSGSLTFSKYNTNNLVLFPDQIAKTVKKMTVVCTGSLTPDSGSVTFFKWSMFFPSLQFADGTPNAGGPQRMAWTANFTASKVTSAPTGFTAGYTMPLVLEIVNQLSTDALA